MDSVDNNVLTVWENGCFHMNNTTFMCGKKRACASYLCALHAPIYKQSQMLSFEILRQWIIDVLCETSNKDITLYAYNKIYLHLYNAYTLFMFSPITPYLSFMQTLRKKAFYVAKTYNFRIPIIIINDIMSIPIDACCHISFKTYKKCKKCVYRRFKIRERIRRKLPSPLANICMQYFFLVC